MSERLARELPGSVLPMRCETWETFDEDEPLIERALTTSGIRLTGPIEHALASAHPAELSEVAVEAMDPAERVIYERERGHIAER